MPGGPKSELSIKMSNVKRDINRGTTQGKHPRPYTPAELEQQQDDYNTLLDQKIEERQNQQTGRINTHATKESDRVIVAFNEGNRDAANLFAAFGGAGSSSDLLLQADSLIKIVKILQKTEQAAEKAASSTSASICTPLGADTTKAVALSDKAASRSEAKAAAKDKAQKEKAAARDKAQKEKAAAKEKADAEKAAAK